MSPSRRKAGAAARDPGRPALNNPQQMLLQLAVGMGPRGEADRRALPNRSHQRARLVRRQPPVANQLPFQPIAQDADQLLDQLVGQFRPPDQPRMDLLVAPGNPGSRAASVICEMRGPGIVDQPRHDLVMPGGDQRLRDHLGQPRRPATASAYCMALVRTTRTRSSSLSTGLCSRIGRAISIRSSASCCATFGGSGALAATVVRQRLPHLDRKIADQKLEHGIGQRPAIAGAELVELPAELGRDLRPCTQASGRAAGSSTSAGAQPLLALACPHGAAAAPRAAVRPSPPPPLPLIRADLSAGAHTRPWNILAT